MPVLHLELSSTPVYFEHHILLWKDPRVEVEIKPMKRRAQKNAGRHYAGLPATAAAAHRWPHQRFVSRDGAGHVFALHLSPGEASSWMSASTSF